MEHFAAKLTPAEREYIRLFYYGAPANPPVPGSETWEQFQVLLVGEMISPAMEEGFIGTEEGMEKIGGREKECMMVEEEEEQLEEKLRRKEHSGGGYGHDSLGRQRKRHSLANKSELFFENGTWEEGTYGREHRRDRGEKREGMIENMYRG